MAHVFVQLGLTNPNEKTYALGAALTNGHANDINQVYEDGKALKGFVRRNDVHVSQEERVRGPTTYPKDPKILREDHPKIYEAMYTTDPPTESKWTTTYKNIILGSVPCRSTKTGVATPALSRGLRSLPFSQSNCATNLGLAGLPGFKLCSPPQISEGLVRSDSVGSFSPLSSWSASSSPRHSFNPISTAFPCITNQAHAREADAPTVAEAIVLHRECPGAPNVPLRDATLGAAQPTPSLPPQNCPGLLARPLGGSMSNHASSLSMSHISDLIRKKLDTSKEPPADEEDKGSDADGDESTKQRKPDKKAKKGEGGKAAMETKTICERESEGEEDGVHEQEN